MTPYEQGYYTFMKLAVHGDPDSESGVPATPASSDEDGRLYTREDVQYMDSSPHKDKKCEGCVHYQTDGTCGIVMGKINPNGYCNNFRDDRIKESSAASHLGKKMLIGGGIGAVGGGTYGVAKGGGSLGDKLNGRGTVHAKARSGALGAVAGGAVGASSGVLHHLATKKNFIGAVAEELLDPF